MTNKDSHIIFKVVLDKNAEGIAYGGCPAFLDEEVDLFLNQAQLEILSNKITGNNALRIGLEGSVSNLSEIEKLIATEVNLHAVHTDYNEYVLEDVHDEDNRMTILSVLLKYGQFQTNCVLTSHELVKPFKQTYNNIPWVENPVATLENDKLLVYVDPVLMQDPMYAPRVEQSSIEQISLMLRNQLSLTTLNLNKNQIFLKMSCMKLLIEQQ